MRKIGLILILVCLILPVAAWAATYYVDKDNRFGNGCSNTWPGTQTQPKCDFTQDWFRTGLRPGDTVIIRESDTYGQMRIDAASSGTVDNPIIIKPYPGEKIKLISGGEIFFGSNTSYVTIQGPVEIANSLHSYHTSDNIQNNGNYGLVLDNCEIHNTRYGPYLLTVHDSKLSNCEIHDLSGFESNGVHLVNTVNVTIDHVNVARVDDGQSPDNSSANGFDTYGGENLIIKNSSASYIKQDGFDLNANVTLINCRAYNNMGAGLKIWRRSNDNYAGKTATVINSLFYNNGYYAPDPNQGSPGIGVFYGAGINLYNSVVDNNYDYGIRISGDAPGVTQLPIKIYNNIISNSIAGYGIRNDKASNFVSSDNNLYFNNYGRDTNGLNAESYSIFGQDPLFSSDYSLKPGSPAIDKGTDLSSLGYNYDILNKSRPQGAGWDIGAYEYVSFLFGDVSGDGEVSAYDAALTAQTAVGLITLTSDQTKAADVSGDGEVSAYDAALIAQKAVGLIDKFPAEG